MKNDPSLVLTLAAMDATLPSGSGELDARRDWHRRYSIVFCVG